MATDYHVVTLPNKTRVPVRDHFLRDGKTFSMDGDVTAVGVTFDGMDDVELVSTIGDGKVTLAKVNRDAKTSSEADIHTGNPQLATAGDVADHVSSAINSIGRVSDEDIDALFGPQQP